MIEQAGMVLKHLLARVLGRTADRETIARDLRQAAQLGGLDLDILRLCDGPTLAQVVAPGGETDPSRAWLAAETLFVDGCGAQIDDRPGDAAASFTKALTLYRLLEPTDVLPTGFPEATERIREIEERLRALPDSGNGRGGPAR
ncbi:MAG: hypothetical protein IH616_03135 [Gemmatimonadales bacterium]|nr:hypothetical protein [Gemmatimonadales bacterium]